MSNLFQRCSPNTKGSWEDLCSIFTIKSMFQIMNDYAEIVHIAPRTYSRRSGILGTAYFYLEKLLSNEEE